VTAARSFDALIEDAEHAPIEGWDFTWLDGRATEERPSWRYSDRVAERAASATRMLDLQSGGGEMLAGLRELPPLLIASEGYAPNVAVAARNLRPRRASVVAAHDDRAALPFAGETFDLVTSRHPVQTWWSEIARVLQPGGT
jgi:SAM-dependent methyltransferase